MVRLPKGCIKRYGELLLVLNHNEALVWKQLCKEYPELMAKYTPK
jgi:hypothetical protein